MSTLLQVFPLGFTSVRHGGLALLLLAVACGGPKAFGQGPVLEAPAPVRPLPVSPPVQPPAPSGSLAARPRLGLPPVPAANSILQVADEELTLAPTDASLEQEKSDRLDRLRRQIEELRKSKDAAPPEAPPEPVVPTPPEPEAPPAAPAPQTTPAVPIDITTPPPHDIPAPLGDVVVEGPVDRLGLADSLFASGQVALALEMYAQLDVGGQTADVQQWVAFQQASCHRRLGDLAEAERRYREVVASGAPGWLSDLCRWWLQAIEDRRRLAGNAVKFQTILKELDAQLARELTTTP
jgi:hypothetical protein